MRNNYLYHKGSLLINPGDLVDKQCILHIKLCRITDPNKLSFVEEELERVEILLYRIKEVLTPHQKNVLTELRRDLLHINQEQWNWEDRVRAEKSGEAAYGARECNSRRVAKKNEINQVFGYPTEQKLYVAQ